MAQGESDEPKSGIWNGLTGAFAGFGKSKKRETEEQNVVQTVNKKGDTQEQFTINLAMETGVETIGKILPTVAKDFRLRLQGKKLNDPEYPNRERAVEESGVIIMSSQIPNKSHENQDYVTAFDMGYGERGIVLIDGASNYVGEKTNSEEYAVAYGNFLKSKLSTPEYSNAIRDAINLMVSSDKSEFEAGLKGIDIIMGELQNLFMIDARARAKAGEKGYENFTNWGAIGYCSISIISDARLVNLEFGRYKDSGYSLISNDGDPFFPSDLFKTEPLNSPYQKRHALYARDKYNVIQSYYGDNPLDENGRTLTMYPAEHGVGSGRVSIIYGMSPDDLYMKFSDGSNRDKGLNPFDDGSGACTTTSGITAG
ncbi:MAG: hypothetical protein ABIM99_02510 [Candidatus Dojkabacteria bacterium]